MAFTETVRAPPTQREARTLFRYLLPHDAKDVLTRWLLRIYPFLHPAEESESTPGACLNRVTPSARNVNTRRKQDPGDSECHYTFE